MTCTSLVCVPGGLVVPELRQGRKESKLTLCGKGDSE